MKEYIVPDGMKKVWAVEIDLLNKFKEICSRHGLRYYAIAGTLLGAVRHKGFIPWDDDIDVAMPWSDCKKFMEIAPHELSYPYFLQCYQTEIDAELHPIRLRRSDTTGCTKWEFDNVSDPNYNLGLFIDIFPLFYVPQDSEMKARQKELIIDVWKAFRGYTAIQGQKRGLETMNPEYANYIDVYRRYSEKYSLKEIKEIYYERCAMQQEPSDEVGITSFRVHDPLNVWKTEWFKETVELPFENTFVAAPKYYEEWLDHRYGNWREPVYNSAGHEIFIFDADVPYKEKLKRS